MTEQMRGEDFNLINDNIQFILIKKSPITTQSILGKIHQKHNQVLTSIWTGQELYLYLKSFLRMLMDFWWIGNMSSPVISCTCVTAYFDFDLKDEKLRNLGIQKTFILAYNISNYYVVTYTIVIDIELYKYVWERRF